MANGGQDMLDELYADNKCSDAEKIPDMNITLKIPLGNIVHK